jgi:hypothetical protein
MKFLYVDVEHRKVVALFRNTNEEIIKLNMRDLQILSEKERYVFNSNILSEIEEAIHAVGQFTKGHRPWWQFW